MNIEQIEIELFTISNNIGKVEDKLRAAESQARAANNDRLFYNPTHPFYEYAKKRADVSCLAVDMIRERLREMGTAHFKIEWHFEKSLADNKWLSENLSDVLNQVDTARRLFLEVEMVG